jgi:hypothetical protein
MATEAQKRIKARLESKAYRREPAPPKPLEADPGAEDTYKKFVDSARTLAASSGKTNADGSLTEAASFLSGSSFDLIERASQDAGIKTEDLLAEVERFRPGSINKFYLQKKGLSTSSEGDRPGKAVDARGPSGAPPSRFSAEEDTKLPGGRTINTSARSTKGKGKTEVDFDSKPRPLFQDALGARSKEDKDQFVRAMGVEGVDRQGDNVREAVDFWVENNDKRKGPGGKGAGTQEDFAAYRAQKAIDDAVAERERQAKISFLRRGGRYAADGFGTTVGGQQVSLDRPDGQRLAVLPGRGKTPADQRSGAYAYADELQDEARLAENARNRERQQNFVANLGEPGTQLGKDRETKNIRRAEAEAFLTNIKRAARGADKTAREIARGYEQGQYGRRNTTDYSSGAADFFDEADQLGSVKAQLRGKDQEAQVRWARQQLDAREEARREQAQKDEERRRNMASGSYQDLVDKYRNPSSSSFSTVNFGI